MSGQNDSSDAPDTLVERLKSAAISARAVRGILWGAELTASEISIKSIGYFANWWSRGESNP